MSSAPVIEPALTPEERLELFFANIHQCRDKGYATHSLHPYPAKFIPHIPREVIRTYSKPGDRVWDPMCGSGTAVVEAAIEGRVAIGGDINPIAVLVSRAKTTRLGISAQDEITTLADCLWTVADSSEMPPAEIPEFHNRDHWFEPLVSGELAYALKRISDLRNPAAADLARCAFSAILVGVSNQESETRWSAKPQTFVPGRALGRLATKLQDSVERVEQFAERTTTEVKILREDARESTVDDESVELVVTSPPYANSHDYYLYNKLRMFWLGYDVKAAQEAEIGSRNRHSDRGEDVDTYLDSMAQVLAEMHRCLVPGGRAVLVVADAVIRGRLFEMDELLSSRAHSAGLSLVQGFRFNHRRFNATFQRGFGTSQEKATHVLVFQRH